MPSKPPAKRRCGGRYPAGWVTQRRNLLLRTQQAARAGLIGISRCASPVNVVVPFGGAEIYYGTNPLAFAAPGEGDGIIPLIWRLPYRHGEKYSTPARAICLSGYLGSR